jgi:hypothetical protein
MRIPKFFENLWTMVLVKNLKLVRLIQNSKLRA